MMEKSQYTFYRFYKNWINPELFSELINWLHYYKFAYQKPNSSGRRQYLNSSENLLRLHVSKFTEHICSIYRYKEKRWSQRNWYVGNLFAKTCKKSVEK